MAKVEVEVVVEATIEVEEEMKKDAREQYGLVDNYKIAENVLSLQITRGLDYINSQETYWDGVANLKGTILKIDTKLPEELI